MSAMLWFTLVGSFIVLKAKLLKKDVHHFEMTDALLCTLRADPTPHVPWRPPIHSLGIGYPTTRPIARGGLGNCRVSTE